MKPYLSLPYPKVTYMSMETYEQHSETHNKEPQDGRCFHRVQVKTLP